MDECKNTGEIRDGRQLAGAVAAAGLRSGENKQPRLQTLSHGGDHSDGAGGDMTPGHMNNANKNYPDSGVTTRLGTHCSYHLLERNHF